MTKIFILRFFSIFCLFVYLANFPGAEAAVRKGKLQKKPDLPTENTLNRSVLPKKGDIAVVVEGDDDQQIRTVETIIIETLVSRGYRVVDEAKMKRIRVAAARAKAARLALEGNVEGILKINAGYSAAATVIARIKVGKPVLNEFQLYTCSSMATLMAVTSNGTKLGGKNAQSKQIGYTEEEAAQKALETVVESGMSQMF